MTRKHGARYLIRRRRWIKLGRTQEVAKAQYRAIIDAKPGTYMAAV